jgi:hypothetical protein
MEIFSPLLDQLTPAFDISNTLTVIGELYLKPPECRLRSGETE